MSHPTGPDIVLNEPRMILRNNKVSKITRGHVLKTILETSMAGENATASAADTSKTKNVSAYARTPAASRCP